MEVTSNLDVAEWYSGEHPLNNLQYWGLDYPPLTAYHSWLCGVVFKVLCPQLVELGLSRGIETPSVKAWMRSSVLISDSLSFVPATLMFLHAMRKTEQERYFHEIAFLSLTNPALMLIDHGHFQFNCICHGLFVLSLLMLVVQHPEPMTHRQAVLASVCFCMALNFKQMALFYSLAIFCHLLRWALVSPDGSVSSAIKRLVLLGVTVLSTFAILWFPLRNDVVQVVKRIFPFERGVFEDKVANFWFSTNLVVKWKVKVPQATIGMASLLLTVLSTLPSCYMTLTRTCSPKRLLLSFFTISLGFFLFSFQVHEKSILLPVVVTTLIADFDLVLFFWFSNVALLSLLPLLIRDGLLVVSLLVLAMHLGVQYRWQDHFLETSSETMKKMHKLCFLAGLGCTIVLVANALCIAFLPSPFDRFPDLFVVLHCVLCFVLFMGFFVYANYQQFKLYHQESRCKEIKSQ